MWLNQGLHWLYGSNHAGGYSLKFWKKWLFCVPYSFQTAQCTRNQHRYNKSTLDELCTASTLRFNRKGAGIVSEFQHIISVFFLNIASQLPNVHNICSHSCNKKMHVLSFCIKNIKNKVLIFLVTTSCFIPVIGVLGTCVKFKTRFTEFKIV